MKNQLFDIKFNEKEGTIVSIKNPGDRDEMNWCLDRFEWGRVYNKNYKQVFAPDNMRFVSFTEGEAESISEYTNDKLEVTVFRFFDDDGNFTERYTIKNLRDTPVFLEHGELGISVPFNDCYTYAEDCMVHRCNAHIWCGYNCTYVNAVKMGVSDINLGLVLTKGSVPTYSINKCDDTDRIKSWDEMGALNFRGEFLLDCDNVKLLPEEEYVIEWVLFWHKGGKDFSVQASRFDTYIDIDAVHYTVFGNENIEFSAKLPQNSRDVKILLDGAQVDFERENNVAKVSYKPAKCGEHRFYIYADNIKTYAEFLAVSKFEDIIEKRVNFIADNQQYIGEGEQLDGAFLIYDNTEECMYFDGLIGDHNACHERIGMALLLVKYLQKHKNEKIMTAVNRYIEFVKREFYIEETGFVCKTIGRDDSEVRLYDLPWVTMLFTEMYILTKDTYYTDQVMKMFRNYYAGGGLKFYPNGISLYKTYTAVKEADSKNAEELLEMFRSHVGNMLKNGVAYPRHEVNYEQTIVSPAATFISEMGYLTGEEIYVGSAKLHLDNLALFNGHQPSYHLNEIPIRYWDDFWFGKSRMFADTFPHYWSCLTARSYVDYHKISGDENFLSAAKECIRNCLCLFTEDGRGSAAYVYPFRVDGKKGQFYDEWANDQDFALYFALDIIESIGMF